MSILLYLVFRTWLEVVEKQSLQMCPLSSPAALHRAQHLSWQIMHLCDVERQVTQGMELNAGFFLVFLDPDLLGRGDDGAAPAAALGLLLVAVAVLLLLLFLAAFAAALFWRISFHSSL